MHQLPVEYVSIAEEQNGQKLCKDQSPTEPTSNHINESNQLMCATQTNKVLPQEAKTEQTLE